ncbi:hypothetical protein F5X99DRAFT_376680 [Biscogniauxia marginata]|nr:hypothetical protein F5X99DRAFT_376680 [Biscogniauxia marginata]
MQSPYEDEFSTTTSEGKTRSPTPTHSILSEDENSSSFCINSRPGTVPWPGNIYMIRHRESGKAITMGIRDLRLEKMNPLGGWHWLCVERDGWFGFRNIVSGMLLGHDGGKTFYARAKDHKSWEYFVARAHPRGGYELLTLHRWKFWKLAVANDGYTLIETEDEGALWDFVEI